MSTQEFNARIRLKRDTSANWTQNDPILLNGEIIIVDTADGKVRTKTGNGTKKYSQLPFDDEEMRNYVNSMGSVCIEATLSADAWSNKIQTVQIAGLGAAQNGIVSLRHGCTEPQYNAACEAKLMVSRQSKGNLIISANGKVPEIDIPVEIVLLS